MTNISTHIGKAALQMFFPHLHNKQNTSYNPQFNGWDSAKDMPIYSKTNNKTGPTPDYLKEGQKLNAQLVQHIFMGEQFKNQNQRIKPNMNQYENAYQNPNIKTRQNYSANNNQVPQMHQNTPTPSNQRLYNSPTPYSQTYSEQKTTKINQTRYTPPSNQYNRQLNQTVVPSNYSNTNQLNQISNPISNQQVNPESQYSQTIQTIQSNEKVYQSERNPNFERKISAEEMDRILSS